MEDNQTLPTNDVLRGCSPCLEGQLRDSQTFLTCQSCVAGKYSANTGSTVCESCPDGTYSVKSHPIHQSFFVHGSLTL
jgi:hypothetical protein